MYLTAPVLSCPVLSCPVLFNFFNDRSCLVPSRSNESIPNSVVKTKKNRVWVLLYWFYYRIPRVTGQDRIVSLETRQDKTRFDRISYLVPSRSHQRNLVLSRSKHLRQRKILSCPIPSFRLFTPALSCPVDPAKSPSNSKRNPTLR